MFTQQHNTASREIDEMTRSRPSKNHSHHLSLSLSLSLTLTHTLSQCRSVEALSKKEGKSCGARDGDCGNGRKGSISSFHHLNQMIIGSCSGHAVGTKTDMRDGLLFFLCVAVGVFISCLDFCDVCLGLA